MKNAVHQYEDKLLEFAYGELPQHEADAVDAHVRGCARCSQALAEIRGVRATMAQLPLQAAPDAGLESLLAYAEQAAKRNAAAQVKPSLIKRFLMPLASVMALVTVGVVAFRANQEVDLSPASVAAEKKADEYERARAEQKAPAPMPVTAVAEAEAPAPAPTELAAAQPVDGDRARNQQAEADEGSNKRGGKLDELAKTESKPAPESVTRRTVAKAKAAPTNEPQVQDWSNAAQRGGGLRDNATDGKGAKDTQEKRAEVPADDVPAQKELAQRPAEPKADPQKNTDKAIFGLGTGTSGPGAAQGAIGGSVSTGESSLDTRKRAKSEESTKVVAQPSAPPASAPVASTPPPPPAKTPAVRSSLSVGLGRGGASSSVVVEEESVATGDSLRADSDANYDRRRQQATITQALESARVASNEGDRRTEIKLLLEVMKNGPTGYAKVEALKRLCDAFEALGEADRGDRYCDQLLSEFPNTAAAQAVTQRRNAVQRAAPRPAAERKKAAEPQRQYDESRESQQKQSVPAQAY